MLITRNVEKKRQGVCYEMKKTNGNFSVKKGKKEKNPVRQKLIAGLLCICLMMVSLPIEFFSSRVFAEESQKKVLSFSSLPEEIRRQTVNTGTPLKKLNLPDTLEAVCVPAEQVNISDDGKLGIQEVFSETKGAAPEEVLEEPQETSEENNTWEKPQDNSEKDGVEEAQNNSEGTENSSLDDNQDNSEGTENSSLKDNQDNSEGTEKSLLEENQDNSEGTEDSSLEENQEVSDNTESPEKEPAADDSDGAKELPKELEDIPENNPENPTPDAESGVVSEPDPEQNTENVAGETAVIENIIWKSAPDYDSETEGIYVFTPVVPEHYILEEGVTLPEIYVTVKSDKVKEELERKKGQDTERKRKKSGKKEKAEEEFLDGAERIEYFDASTPGCGVISEDTVWNGSGTLENGELVVNPGVTLTINGALNIIGNVTIQGGGTIVRGKSNVQIEANVGVHLTMRNITVDGMSLPSPNSMIKAVSSEVVLDDGCIFRNFIKTEDAGAVLFVDSGGTAVFNDILIENCQVPHYGGAVFVRDSKLTVNCGIYKNNRTVATKYQYGGGCLYNASSKFYICGGKFIGNSSVSRGGCIYCTVDQKTETYLMGGYFEGNTCSYPGYEGSGAIFYSAVDPARPELDSVESILELSGSVKFCGNGDEGSGVDGVYLDINPKKVVNRKIRISNTLSYTIPLYLKAAEKYVIAEGTNAYILLHERDMKKISFYDVENSSKIWYAVLDKENNQIYLSENNPGYKYFVYYISNGADGTVVDDNEYDIGAKATVQSADPLEKEDSTFLEWNTEPDRTGIGYQPGEKFTIEGDTDLYAIFLENKKKSMKANFYSGAACEKKTQSAIVAEDAETGTVTALDLQEMEGFESIGWEKDNSSGYGGEVKPQEEITLSKPETDYYGVYQRDVTLSYQAEGAENIPEIEQNPCRANVHNEITYQEAEFTAASGPSKSGYHFVGWNTQEDEKGTVYQPGDSLKLTEDTTLYAMFLENDKKNFTADFYSGEPGKKETVIKTVEETVPSITIKSLKLQELEGFTPVGWDMDKSSYAGEALQDQDLTLTEEYTSYYGIYQKDVTFTYDRNDGTESSERDTKICRANVHEVITYDVPEFTIASAPSRQAYLFQGWNTQPDGKGENILPKDVIKSDSDRIFYAIWELEETAFPYQVEHYKQDLEGDGYTRSDADTESLMGIKGTEVEASPKQYTGFHINESHSQGKSKGIVEEEGSLVLKLYYDRNVYEVDFNLNGALGKTPDTQKIRYGGLLKAVEDPVRRGYNFKGWHLDDNGLDGGQWDFKNPVENNTDELHTTLYAIWADELAPELEQASFSSGYKDFQNWLIKKKKIVVTVPVTEEGSGLAKAEFLLKDENGTEKDGQAQITEKHELSNRMLSYGSSASLIRAAQAEAEQGAYEVSFIIDEEFKGKVYLTCTDHAGNISARKMLTAAGGGIILEENAPEISFSNTKDTMGKTPINVKISVKDNENRNVSGGIAGISYQLDKKKKVTLPAEDFNQDMVESYQFTVKVTGEGTHTLRVNAKDNAGNESSNQIKLKIHKEKKEKIPVRPEDPKTPENPSLPKGPEPKTGNNSHVKIYATVAMIAGFGYLLLYFEGEHGITEREKDEIVYRLIEWAKRGGKFRRLVGIAVISLFLIYYHSIGKSVSVELKEVYAKSI